MLKNGRADHFCQQLRINPTTFDARLAQEHETLLGETEWVWADSAYPVSF